jgi:hypothetical protein
MKAVPLSLFPGGHDLAFMCSWCGAHLEVCREHARDLGPCPACGCTHWWSAHPRGFDLTPDEAQP